MLIAERNFACCSSRYVYPDHLHAAAVKVQATCL